MVHYKFRVLQDLQIGHKVCSAGDEIILREDEVARCISSGDLRSGRIVFCGEVQGEELNYVDSTSRSYKHGRSIQSGYTVPISLDLIALPVILDFRGGAPTGEKWSATVPCDCVFEGFTLTNLTPAQIGDSTSLDVNVTVTGRTNYEEIPSGTASLLEVTGFRGQYCNSVLVGYTTFMDYTSAAAGGGGTVDLSLAGNSAEYLYVGFYDKFCGVYVTIDTANTAAATIAAQYPRVSSDGEVTWTSLSITDGTLSAGTSFAQNGAIVWNTPADWAKQTISDDYGSWYYVRFYVPGSTGISSSADAAGMRIVTNILKPYDNPSFINAGDTLSISLASTGATTTSIYTGVVYLRRVN